MRLRQQKESRKGEVVVLAALMFVLVVGLLAFTVDVGCLLTAKIELQRSADAAALAGALQLISKDAPGPTLDLSEEIACARTAAVQYADLNKVWGKATAITANDIVVGYLANPTAPGTSMSFDNPNQFNVVQANVSAPVTFYFAPIFSKPSQLVTTQATAAILTNFGGFQDPPGGSNLNVLPFALDKATWDGLMIGTGADQWTWDVLNNRVMAGRDGVQEASLYPTGTGAAGNRGTVDIGQANNSTADVKRQITSGISPDDLAALGGKLALSSDGTLLLNGDTGISAGVKDALSGIIGMPRIVPLFTTVSGNGNHATYTIVGFAGVRIMNVQLTGNNKAVVVQPCSITTHGGTPPPMNMTTSWGIYSLPFLIR